MLGVFAESCAVTMHTDTATETNMATVEVGADLFFWWGGGEKSRDAIISNWGSHIHVVHSSVELCGYISTCYAARRCLRYIRKWRKGTYKCDYG